MAILAGGDRLPILPGVDSTEALKILGRNKRLPGKQREMFDRIFHCQSGGVLDFTHATFREWFAEAFDIDIAQARFQAEGESKARMLRCFCEVADPRLVAKVLRRLWQYRQSVPCYVEKDVAEEERLHTWFAQLTAELDAATAVSLDAAIRDFSGDTTLKKLRAAIANDLTSEKPDVALDRLHTYCVKRLRHLLRGYGRGFDARSPLDALFGAYAGVVKERQLVSEVALPALRSQYKLFEGLNQARNTRSLAHDNELLDVSEAQFVVDSVLATLAFIERVEHAGALTAEATESIPF